MYTCTCTRHSDLAPESQLGKKKKKKNEIDYQNLKYSAFTGLQTSAEAPSEITLLFKKNQKKKI